jgi:hypothetical protein
MHKTITGLFDNGVCADRCTKVLKRCGFPRHDISVLASDTPWVDETLVGQVDAVDGGVLVGVSAPDDLVDVARDVLLSAGATSIEVS